MEDLVKQIINSFEEILTSVSYNRGDIIHKANTTSNRIFIVKSGILRSCYFNDGKDITAHFAMEYSIIGAVDSLLKQTKSIYRIEALEQSEVLVMDYNEMEKFLDRNPELERLARKISQFLYLELVERMEGIMFQSAKERYHHLLNRYPDITQKVNLSHIASFLGITQETLSRIRKST